MKKKQIILTVALSCLFFVLCTGNVFAAKDEGDNAAGVASATDVENSSENGIIGAEPLGELVPYEFDSYHLVDMRSLFNAGKISLSEDMASAVFNIDKEGELGITDLQKNMNLGRVSVTDEFDFNAKPVGRVVVDGYSEKGTEVYVDVYIDAEATPICSIKLPEKPDPVEENAEKPDVPEGQWDAIRDKETKYFPTADVYSRRLTGTHNVSFGFRVTGKTDDENVDITLKSIEFAENTIPVVYFNIDETQGTIDDMNGSPDHSARCYGSVDIRVPEEYVSEYTGQTETDYTGLTLDYIRGRGNSTWKLDKKPYKFKLSKKTDLFGMGKNKHWVLVANRYDNSNIRNRMTYWLGAELGMEYTPQCLPVEVVMNGRYYGTYLLAEQVRLDENRVDIDELDASDYDAPIITGGYLLSMNPYPKEADENKFNTEKGVELMTVSPDFSESGNEKQWDYITKYIQTVENSVLGDGFKDEDGHSYKEYMDFNALVDYWWVQEFSKNGDAFVTGSTYLYKKRDTATQTEKLYWGPLWDFDFVAWGDLEYLQYDIESFNYTSMLWINALKKDPTFIEAVKRRWPDFESALNEIIKDGGLLDTYYEEMKTSAAYNYELWGAYESNLDYKGEIEQLRGWINSRLSWVKENFDTLDNLMAKLIYKVDDKVIDTLYVPIGSNMTYQPEIPAKEGCLSVGWFDENGNKIDYSTQASNDLIIHAEYIEKSKAKKIDEVFFRDYDVYKSITFGSYYPDYGYFPSDAANLDLIWSSSDESIATVDPTEGTVSFNKVGDVVITATTLDGKKTDFRLHIRDGFINKPLEEIYYENGFELCVGGYKQCLPSYKPIEANLNLDYTIKDDSIATVDGCGVVTGVSPGETELVAHDWQTGLEVTCKIIVKEKSSDDPVTPDEPDDKKVNPDDGKKNQDKKEDSSDKKNDKSDKKTTGSNEWIDGKWYDADGKQTYKPLGHWMKNSKGWWFEDTSGWYPRNTWQKINGKWYFFTEDGYMDYSEYRQGYWLGSDGAWVEEYYGGHWMKNSKGWWYEDVTGWYPDNRELWIDGVKYLFDSKGYLL